MRLMYAIETQNLAKICIQVVFDRQDRRWNAKKPLATLDP